MSEYGYDQLEYEDLYGKIERSPGVALDILKRINEDMPDYMLEQAIVCGKDEIYRDVVCRLIELGTVPKAKMLGPGVLRSTNTSVIRELLKHLVPSGSLLHDAIKFSVSADTVKLLLEHGAPPNAKNDDGILPLDITLYSDMQDHSEVLRHYGAQETKEGQSFLKRKYELRWEEFKKEGLPGGKLETLAELYNHGCPWDGIVSEQLDTKTCLVA